MAITTDDSIKAILKAYILKEGVSNLFLRNDPFLNEIEMTRVEGKTANYAAMYGRGGAVSGDYTVAQAKAAKNTKNVEFAVEPGQIFSVYSMNAKEIQASLTQKGGYMKVAGNKLDAATEAFRKTVAAAFYGSGFGEIAKTTEGLTFVKDTAKDITLPESACFKIDGDTELEIKTSLTAAPSVTLTVNSVNGTTVNVTPDTTVSDAISAGAYVCIAGSVKNGKGILPVGLGGWLPIAGGRADLSVAPYSTEFFGVTRNVAIDRLGGAFYMPSGSETKAASLKKLLRKVRRQGSRADIIIMNDADFEALSNEIETTNTYLSKVAEGNGKKKATVGMDKISASASTSFVENIYDSPACPEGVFYILDSKAVKLASYTKADKAKDGITDNQPGTEELEDNDGYAKEAYKLMIDDSIQVVPGVTTWEGPATEVSVSLYGSFIITNPAHCGVGLFYNANGYTGVLGY